MSSRSRRVAAKVWKAGDVVWVEYEAAYRGTLDKRLEGSTTWDVSFDNGDREQVPERLLLRAEPAAEEESSDERLDDNDAPAGTPARKKQKSGGGGPTSARKKQRSGGSAPPADCGAPRDKSKAKLFYQFLYYRATQRRLMYPQETVVGSGAELPPAELPTAGQGGWDLGPNIMGPAKWGNACRYLDSGDRVTGVFVRAKLEHLGLALDSPKGIAAALSMCVVEMDGWRVDFLRRWTAQTPKDWFRMPKGQLQGVNIPAGREEVKNFVSFARRVMRNEDGPFFSASYQVQGRRLVDSRMRPEGRESDYDERLAVPDGVEGVEHIDGVVAKLAASKTWEEAIMAVRLLAGAGPFVGGQALLTFLYGVCEGDVSSFAPSLDVGTMADYCSYSPGPKKMIVKLWKTPEPNEAEVVTRIVWLAKNADAEFAKLGLAFPYQVEDGRRRALTAVDMEHSLCYFSRYLKAHDDLRAAGAATVYKVLSGPVTNKDCPRPSIKWLSTLTAHTAADRCRKWIGGEEVDAESDSDEEAVPPRPKKKAAAPKKRASAPPRLPSKKRAKPAKNWEKTR